MLAVRRIRSIGTLLLAATALMTLVLVVIFAVHAVRALESRKQAQRVPRIVDISTDLFLAIQNFRVERGTVNTALATPEPVAPESQIDIETLRARSAESLDSALAKLNTIRVDGIGSAIAKIGERRGALIGQRPLVDAALLLPKDRPACRLQHAMDCCRQ